MQGQPGSGSRSRQVRRLIDSALMVVVIGLFGLGAAAVISGDYQIRPVLSGSMRPGLPVGGIVITERVPTSTLQVRDVVVFHRPDKPAELVVHRIIELNPSAAGPIVQTQGDANTVPDPWKVSLHGTTAYRAVFSLPLIGYAAVWAHNPTGRQTLTLVGMLLVVGAAIGAVITRLLARRASPGKNTGADASRTAPDAAAPSPSHVDADLPVEAKVASTTGA